MNAYCPWGDVGERYPTVLVAVRDIYPARGAWCADAGVIFVDAGLGRRERRSVLAHEIAHMDLAHEHRDFPWFSTRQEREADMLASRRLITVEAFADAYASTHDDEQLAEALNVCASTVRVRVAHLHPSERHSIEQRIAALERAA